MRTWRWLRRPYSDPFVEILREWIEEWAGDVEPIEMGWERR